MKTLPWISILSIALQQLVFFAFQSFRFPLIGLSWWVVSVPVWVLWMLYFIVPVVYARPFERVKYMKDLALRGWLFVLASGFWNVAYIAFSNAYGIPVSSGH